jgi:hypothetical protein
MSATSNPAYEFEAMNEIEELRARIEALEVMIHELQTMHNTAVDWRMEQDRRLNQLEATQYAHRPSHLTDAERKQIREDLARPAAWQPLKIATETTYGTAPIVAPSSPAGSLVERLAHILAPNHPTVARGMARDAIRLVAAWLREQAPEPGPVGKWLGQISTPFAVMADILTREANQ